MRRRLPSSPGNAAARWQRLAVAAVAALALLEFLWELWLAPLKPGGSWLALKALPLAVLWPGLVRGALKSRQWLALLLPLYVAEGVVRALSEAGRHAIVAWAVTLLSVVAFGALLASFRATRMPSRRSADDDPSGPAAR
jgi:uncharacterized membrane protein